MERAKVRAHNEAYHEAFSAIAERRASFVGGAERAERGGRADPVQQPRRTWREGGWSAPGTAETRQKRLLRVQAETSQCTPKNALLGAGG